MLMSEQGSDVFKRGVWQAGLVQSLTLLLIICFTRAVFTDPGAVPEGPEWRGRDAQNKLRMQPGSDTGLQITEPGSVAVSTRESKQSGGRAQTAHPLRYWANSSVLGD